MYYVEKYYNDEYYQAGEMSSCKSFVEYDKARNYFVKVGGKYKKGFVILSQDDEYGGTEILEEIACENNK